MFDGSIPSKPKTWTPERLATLARLVGEGLTYSVIAAQMGISRNAAIGKAGRLRIKNGHPPWRTRDGVPCHRPRKRRQAHPLKGRKTMRFAQDAVNARLRAAPVAPPQPPPEGSKTLMELGAYGRECRHPYGSASPYLFCAEPTKDGHAYCDAHERVNFQPLIPSTQRLIWRGR